MGHGVFILHELCKWAVMFSQLPLLLLLLLMLMLMLQ